MDAVTLQDRISRGMGTAARAAGLPYDAFRPAGYGHPLVPENRFLRLHAVFNARDPRFGKASSYGQPAWFGVFDSAYTKPGDYLVGRGGVFFIAAQEHLLPPLCILTNATVSVWRPTAAGTVGLQGYGGVRATGGGNSAVLTGWPASVLAAGGGGRAVLPSDGRPGSWTVLLPLGPFAVRTSDLLKDGDGRTFVVSTAEQTGLGWRIGATQDAA